MVSRFRPHAGAFLPVVLLIAAFGLRIWNLNEPSIWHDEAWSIRAIRDPIHTPDDNTPPVYYTLVHFLWLGAGETPFALRYGSVLLDLLTVALGVRLVRRWAGRDAALLAGVFLAGSPLLWAYAREVRAYAAVPLLTLALLGLVERLLTVSPPSPNLSLIKRKGERRIKLLPSIMVGEESGMGGEVQLWLLLLLTELILLYTHNLSVPVVGWLNLTVGSVWLWQRRWRRLVIWIAGQIAVLIAYLPWVLGQSPSGTPLNTPPDLTPALAWDIWQSYFAPHPAQLGAENALVIASALTGIAAALSVAVILTRCPTCPRLLVLSQAVIIPILATVELLAARIDFHPRYYIPGAPAALLLIPLAVTCLHAPELRRLAAPASLALACGAAAASLSGLLDNPKYQHDDFRAIAEYYAALPDDALIVIPYGWEPALDVYYADKLGIRAAMVELDLHGDWQTARRALNAALQERFETRGGPVHVELLDWYQLPADLRGMLPCLLESAGQREGSGLVVQGIATQGYRVERLIEVAELTPPDTVYGPLTLTGAAVGGQQAICVHTSWTLRDPTADDWRVSGRLVTIAPPGETLASRDSTIRRDDQAPTSVWESGDTGGAFSLLRLPPGTPPGEYRIGIAVYPASRPQAQVRALGVVQTAGATADGFADAFMAHLPARPDMPLALDEGVDLLGHDAADGVLYPGQKLRIILYWRAEHVWNNARLVLRGADGAEWAGQPVAAYPVFSRDWHVFTVPAEAVGRATLTLESASNEPFRLAAYTIEESDHLFVPPAYEIEVGAVFSGVAVLEGASVAQTAIAPDQPLALTLVWRATATPDTPYVVFAHLLNADGQVIAQDDHPPVNGTRPTTSWVAGEYIVDRYSLVFKPGMTYNGPARIEVGFYHPEDWTQRVPVAGGGDHVILPVEITVQ